MTTSHNSQTMDVKLEARVGRVEGIVETLAKDVEQINKAIITLTDSFSEFKDTIGNKLINATKPQWPLIVSIVSMVIMLLAMGASLIAFIFSGHAASIADIRHVQSVAMDKISDSKYDKGRIDMMCEIMNTKLVGLDDKIESLHEQTSILQTWQTDQIKNVAKNSEKIDNLSNIVERIDNRQYESRPISQ